MNFSQLHERIRTEIIRRIHRGSLTGSLLANQTGLEPSHISNFLRRKRNLSLAAMDRVLIALSLTIEDVAPRLPEERSRAASPSSDDVFAQVPLVPDLAAMHSPLITPSLTLESIRIPAGFLNDSPIRTAGVRRNWQRFVAVRVGREQARSMAPVLLPQSVVLLDRHQRSLAAHRPPLPNLYGINLSGALVFRYVTLDGNCIALRPHSLRYPVELLNDAAPSDYIVGRVCVCICQL